ncbi:A-kinase anchor protein 7-like isoform X1 [Daphnia pulex]|uniref:A-kinase anchor protein 7-like isoform X1 n=1 Tax=Daphnia pulex TaxID=6669 RepID=UPI001EDCD7BB|nr:A-kinase anchor protein 7-like isoform X1 [Daphnia pulex]
MSGGPVLRNSKWKKGHESKNKTPRANHFFAVQISDCQVSIKIQKHVSSLSVVVTFQFWADRGSSPQRSQDHIGAGTRVEQRPGVSINSPHHTGSCTPVQPRGFGQVLEETVRVFSTSRLQTQQLDLHLEQVGHFDNKVIYASVKEESEGTEHLNHLSKSLRERCQTAGLTLIDGDRFTPHVTLLKLSKDPSLNRKGIKAVASHLYEKHVDCVFGRQVVESVQLLSMTDPKDEKGYYALKGEFHFGTAAAADEIRTAARLDQRRCSTTKLPC